jgi:hypothetical protein
MIPAVAEMELSKNDRRVEYDKRQTEEDELPNYKKMRDLFIERMYLAENSTRSYLPEVIKFVEMYDRWINKSMPSTVLAGLDHREESLYPLYEDLETQFAILQQKLSESR